MRDRIWFLVLTMAPAVVLPPIGGAAGAVVAGLAGLGSAAMIAAFGGVAAFTFGAVIAVAMLIATLWPW